MLDHTGITVSDFEASKKFYLTALAPLGYAIRKEHPGAAGFGAGNPRDGGDPGGDFWLMQGEPSTPRIHIAFRAQSVEQVQAFHRAALAAGGRDNGAPGLRPQYHAHYYGAFVYDPDGYNIEAVCHREA
ncbi:MULTISPECIES: VOC family protein [Bordetella]|uniref:Glyoxalase n=2 Tax=Bordetella TaxID=517 RepID=A0A261VJ44_9BORD|nr:MULTISPECIES: VOC family protein [Bordetella]MDM9560190.1 VOC family protein [Bordetella petrii]OZI73771.1 glyoxalase [Bordetella genomosp. 2]